MSHIQGIRALKVQSHRDLGPVRPSSAGAPRAASDVLYSATRIRSYEQNVRAVHRPVLVLLIMHSQSTAILSIKSF